MGCFTRLSITWGAFFQPVIGILDPLMNAQRAVVSAEKVFHLLDLEGGEPVRVEETDRPADTSCSTMSPSPTNRGSRC